MRATSAAHEWQRRWRRIEQELQLATDEIRCRQCAALIRHVRHLDTRHRAKQFHCKMGSRAGARRAVIQLAGFRPGERKDIFDRLRGKGRIHQQKVRNRDNERDRRKIA